MKFLNEVSWSLSCSVSANFPVIGLQNLQNSWVFLSWLYTSKLYLLDSSFIYCITSFMEVRVVLIHHQELQYIYPYNVPKHICFITTPHLKLPIYLQLTDNWLKSVYFFYSQLIFVYWICCLVLSCLSHTCLLQICLYLLSSFL